MRTYLEIRLAALSEAAAFIEETATEKTKIVEAVAELRLKLYAERHGIEVDAESLRREAQSEAEFYTGFRAKTLFQDVARFAERAYV